MHSRPPRVPRVEPPPFPGEIVDAHTIRPTTSVVRTNVLNGLDGSSIEQIARIDALIPSSMLDGGEMTRLGR